jgi:hypothetical protein
MSLSPIISINSTNHFLTTHLISLISISISSGPNINPHPHHPYPRKSPSLLKHSNHHSPPPKTHLPTPTLINHPYKLLINPPHF